MKTKKEIDREIKELDDEANGIDDLLLMHVIRDKRLADEMQKRQMSCRAKILALLWVEDDE